MKIPRRLPWLLVALASACATVRSTDEPATKSLPAPGTAQPAPAALSGAPAQDELAQLQDELRQAQREFQDKMPDKPTPEEDRRLADELTQKTRAILDRAAALVEREGGSDLGIRTLVWTTVVEPDAGAREQAVERVMRDHLRSASIAALPETLRGSSPPDTAAMLRRLAAESPHATVQGRALYALAGTLRRDADSARIVATDTAGTSPQVKRLAEGERARLAELDVAQLDREADGILERVARDYGDVSDSRGRKLGPRAEGQLFERQNLQIGKLAPDIEGEDVHGVPFKLSDYRGKVVMLDFWGHW